MIAQNDKLSLKRLLTLARRWLFFVLLTGIISGVVVYMLARQQATTYEATASLLIGVADQQPNQSAAVTAGQGLARTYARTFNNAQLYQQAVQELGLDISAAQLQSAVDVFAVRDTQLVDVKVTWSNPEDAVRITNHMAMLFAKHRQQQAVDALKPTQDFVNEQRAKLAAALKAVPSNQYEAPETLAIRHELTNIIDREQSLLVQTFEIRKQIDVVSPASTAKATEMRPLQLVLIAFLVGAAVATGLVIMAEMFMPTMLPQERAARLGLQSVVELPRLKDPKAPMWRTLLDNSSSPTAQVLRQLPSQLPNSSKIVTVAGLGERTDSSSVVANLSGVYGEGGKRVLLIDANVENPRLDTLLQVKSTAGIQQVLRNPVLLESALVATSLPNVTLLAAKRMTAQDGEAHLDVTAFVRLLEQLRDQFDLVVIDLFEPLRHRVVAGLFGLTDALVLVAHEREISEAALQPYSTWRQATHDNQPPMLIIFNGDPQHAASNSTSAPTPVLAQQT